MTVKLSYSDGVSHSHPGAAPHFHAFRKGADSTDVATDMEGIELAVQHQHPLDGGMLVRSAAVPLRDPAPIADASPEPTVEAKAVEKSGARSLFQLLKLLEQPEHIGEYRVLEKAQGTSDEERTSLGIVYPVGREDAHGDSMTKEEVRKAAHGWAQKGFSASGTQHKDGTGGAGKVMESWLWPDGAPDWHIKRADGSEEVVKAGDWLAVVKWDEPTWADIRKGKYTGYSLQGMGKRVPA